MTNQDLRLQYKRDTGNNADIRIIRDFDLPSDLIVSELNDPIEFDFYVDFDDIPYLEWLEDKATKLISINQLTK